jgi:hypothetical protein
VTGVDSEVIRIFLYIVLIYAFLGLIGWLCKSYPDSGTKEEDHLANLKTAEDHEEEALRYLRRAQYVSGYDSPQYMSKYYVHKAMAEELRRRIDI